MPLHAKPNSTAARDIANVLHPYTNARRHEERGPTVLERGDGIYVYDDNGKEYIEGLAGLWSVALGFGEQRLVDAATEQLRKLPYSHIFSHKSHGPAVDLSEKLVSMTPAGLDHVFFTNSGSEANDTVIKFIWYYNNALGRPEKKKIISREKAYHGVTIAAASLTGLPLNHEAFDVPVNDRFLHTGCPHYYRFGNEGESEEEFATRRADELRRMIEDEGPDTIAAFIAEPVMGAGGVLVPPATYWEKISAVLKDYDILFVADEVINGFGRTGKLFACEHYGLEPDVMVFSKQLTSSYQPLAAIVMSNALYQGIADNTARIGGLGHGFTGSGHPVATAVALENLRIMEERELVDHAARMSPILLNGLRRFEDHPLVGEVRGIGMIAAVELVADKATKESFSPPGKVGGAFFERAHHHGLIIRNIQDSIALCPPLIIEEDQIEELLHRFEATLDDITVWAADNM
ncbi:aspartate aminotransferase family protein [Thalassospiraceae bacterium LMO-JJ14]|nr:aspartate aminotransferase family protein [Thalassospiraceae bacterium LMO-JJ14]